MKFRKYQKQKRRFKGISSNYYYPKNEIIGIKVLKNFRLENNQIESMRRFIQRKLFRKSKNKKNSFNICIFPDLPITSKASGTRMGKGKGSIKLWCFPTTAGRILFELKIRKSFNLIKKHLKGLQTKLPVFCKIIIKKKFMLN